MALEWVPIMEAARRLNKSDRTIKRRIEAGEIESRLENLPTGGVRRLVLIEEESALATPLPTQESPENERDTSGTVEKDTEKTRGTVEKDTRDELEGQKSHEGQAKSDTRDEPQGQAGQAERDNQSIAPDTRDASGTISPDRETELKERLLEQKEEIRFLRGLVEQRDRDAAELRAALREALRAMPRQLPEAATGTTPDTAPSEATQTEQAPDSAPVATPEPPATAESAGEVQGATRRKFWKFWGNK